MKKVLITGANGFLGSWLTKKLVEDGHEVYALVRPKSDISELEGINCNYVYGDVTDIESLRKTFLGMDSVFHLAGVIAYKKSQRSLMERVNVFGTSNVVQVCKEFKIRKLVYLSSVTAIGAGFSEKQILNEKSEYNISDLNLGYFETKKMAEKIVREASLKNEIYSVILNPSTIYGPGDAKKGSRKMQLKVAQGKLKFYTSGGVNVVAVQDVVSGILTAWEKGRNGERYILSGENLLIKDLFKIIAAESGSRAPSIQLPNFFLHGLGAFSDSLEVIGFKSFFSRENAWTSTMFHWFDCKKAERELGFTHRPAREALKNSVQWMKEQHLL